MEAQKSFEPSRITRPIQLLAAWLSGLLLVNGSFLAAAIQLTDPTWLRPLLIIASVINIPVFLGAIFLLQTRFRPEMQEDVYYSEYLGKKMGNTPREITPQAIDSVRDLTQKNFEALKGRIVQLEEQQKKALSALAASTEKTSSRQLKEVLDEVLSQTSKHVGDKRQDISFDDKTIALNVNLSEFKQIAKVFHNHKIPIHEFFGKGAGQPENFALAFGEGFSKSELIAILNAIKEVGNPYISYAADELERNEYLRKILVGSYGVSKTITATEVLEMLTSTDLGVDNIYKMIGKK